MRLKDIQFVVGDSLLVWHDPRFPKYKVAVPHLSKLPVQVRWTLGLVLLLGCLYIIWQSSCAGLSDFDVLQAENLVNSRIEKRLPLDMATLERARVLLESAIVKNANNGAAYQNLALVHEMRVALPWRDLVERDEHLNAALSAALTAVSLRPTSGFAYSVYALAKQMRGEHDAAFRHALARAAKYGPWEPGVQSNIIDVGLRSWDALDEPARDVVRGTITRALQTQPNEIKVFLQARRALLPQCEELRVHIAGLCA